MSDPVLTWSAQPWHDTAHQTIAVCQDMCLGELYLAPLIERAITDHPDVDIIEKPRSEPERSFGM
jgi:hypothetical protein